jgi:hypothetical protein
VNETPIASYWQRRAARVIKNAPSVRFLENLA